MNSCSIENKKIQYCQKQTIDTTDSSLNTNYMAYSALQDNAYINNLRMHASDYIKSIDFLKIEKKNLNLLTDNFEAYMEQVNQQIVDLSYGTDLNKKFKQQKSITLLPHHDNMQLKKMFPEFYYLLIILEKIWYGNKVSEKDIQKIKSCTHIILRAFIKKKFGFEIDFRNNIFLCMSINNIESLSTRKRSEEIYKFFGKRFIKYLQNKCDLNQDKCLAIIQDTFSHNFKDCNFDYYFEIRKKNKKLVLMKANKEFYLQIQKHKSLKNYLSKFRKEFFIIYRQQITKRFQQIFEKMGKIECKQDIMRVRNFINEMENNQNFKLPWTLKEIQEGLNTIPQLIYLLIYFTNLFFSFSTIFQIFQIGHIFKAI